MLEFRPFTVKCPKIDSIILRSQESTSLIRETSSEIGRFLPGFSFDPAARAEESSFIFSILPCTPQTPQQTAYIYPDNCGTISGFHEESLISFPEQFIKGSQIETLLIAAAKKRVALREPPEASSSSSLPHRKESQDFLTQSPCRYIIDSSNSRCHGFTMA